MNQLLSFISTLLIMVGWNFFIELQAKAHVAKFKNNPDKQYKDVFHRQRYIVRAIVAVSAIIAWAFFLPIENLSDKIIVIGGMLFNMAMHWWIYFDGEINKNLNKSLFYIGETSRIDRMSRKVCLHLDWSHQQFFFRVKVPLMFFNLVILSYALALITLSSILT